MLSVHKALMLLDKPFLSDLWETSIKDDNETFGTYIKNINMPQYRGMVYRNGEMLGENKSVNNDNFIKNKDIKIYSNEWRGQYTQEDLDYLNDYLKGLKSDFNIITRNHLDYAKKIAKSSLAMDKAYEDMLNGIGGSEKRYKDLKDTFDGLSKSAQFSENSRSATSAGINGITEVVDKVETKEWIDEIDVEEFPKDELDHLLDQFANIEKSL